MPGLFDPFEVRRLRLKNRIMMSSMNQWAAGEDAVPTDYHFVHFGSRAIGGVGLIFTDGTSIVPNARTSPQDIGIWNDDQVKAFARITKFCQSWGSAMGLQLCYMGRKKHHERGPDYQPRFIAPSAIPFDEDHETPHALTKAEIVEITGQFAAAAGRVVKAGFNVVELQACHGYLISSFISPLSNKRNDEYGGSLKNRTRFGCEVLEAIRATVGDDVPVFARFSATDMVEGGNTVKENVEVARMFKAAGADVMHVSIGGFDTHSQQAQDHVGLLQAVDTGLAAFYQDLVQMGVADDVLLMTFSEFGRRVRENGSLGTDHGTAAPMFVMGNPAQGGLFGAHPSLNASDLDDNEDMVFQVDFRSVYSTVLESWLGVEPTDVLGARYENLGFVK